jgi:uncharacterized damage-inducible protein DinB
MTARERLLLEPDGTGDPEVGRWLAAMEDGRRDTLAVLDGVRDEMVDARPHGGENTIGTALYHVALIEADWLFDDMLGEDLGGTELAPLFPFDARDEAGILTGVAGMSLAEHLERLARVRTTLIERVAPMSLEAFITPRQRADYDVSPVWAIHHLLQHESEHRSEIGWLKRHTS